MDDDATAVFEAFVWTHGLALARLARLLVRDRDDADDLTQATLERAYARWGRVSAADDPLAYVRRMLVHAAVDASRASARRPRTTELIEVAAAGRATDGVEDRAALRGWLSALPARQRAVVVLRHYVGLSEAATAQTLGVSVGTVKTHSSRGLARLREQMGDRDG